MADKKQIQDPLDLDQAMSSSEAFIIKYKNKFLAGIAAIVIVVGGVLGYQHFISEPNEKKASEALFRGEQYFMADNYEYALNGDSLGFEGLLKVANEFSGTDAGKLANAYAGVCYAQLGQNDKAASALMKAASMSDSHSLSPIYLLQAGQIYEELGQNDKAVEAYKQIKNKYFNSMQAYDIDKYIERASMK